jgi:hypothetical protein
MSHSLQGSDTAELQRLVSVRDKEAENEELKVFKIDVSEMTGMPPVSQPGPVKQVTRSISKTVRSYRGNFRRLTDLVRTTIVFSTFDDIKKFLIALRKISICSPHDFLPSDYDGHPFQNRLSADDAKKFNDCPSRIVMQILRIRNRFDPSPEYKRHLFGGYRDISLKVKMAFICSTSGSNSDRVKFVPMSRWREPGTKRLVFEIQLHLQAMQLGLSGADKARYHHNYVRSRDIISK